MPYTVHRISNTQAAEFIREAQQDAPAKYWTVSEPMPDAECYALADAVDGSIVAVGALRDVGADAGLPDSRQEVGALCATMKGAGAELLRELIRIAGTRALSLDCFGDLASYYARFGFQVTESVPFNAEYAPELWREEYGRPEVHFMYLRRAGLRAWSHPLLTA